MGINIRGELTVVAKEDTKRLQYSMIANLAEAMRLGSVQVFELVWLQLLWLFVRIICLQPCNVIELCHVSPGAKVFG